MILVIPEPLSIRPVQLRCLMPTPARPSVNYTTRHSSRGWQILIRILPIAKSAFARRMTQANTAIPKQLQESHMVAEEVRYQIEYWDIFRVDKHCTLFPLDWNLEFTITTAFCDDHLYTMTVADNTAYMPCHGKSQMVTVDLTNFQINVLFTPDTQWFHPGMFTVDKDIYTIYSSYTGSPNKVRWK